MANTKITINDVERVARKLAELQLTTDAKAFSLLRSDITEVFSEVLGENKNYIHEKMLTNLILTNYVKDTNTVGYGGNLYRLTEKAMELLRIPPLSKKIFISYKRNQNPLLALFLHTRLMLAGATPFLDIRNIPTGQSWHQALKDNVKGSDYFISLLAPETLKSEPVATEISWARQYGILTIPVRHAEFDFGTYDHDWAISEDDYNWLKRRNGTPEIIQDDNMDSIRSQTEFLLNSLGYSVL